MAKKGRPVKYHTAEEKKEALKRRAEYNREAVIKAIKKYNLKIQSQKDEFIYKDQRFLEIQNKMEEIANEQNTLIVIRDEKHKEYNVLRKQVAKLNKDFAFFRNKRKLLVKELGKEFKIKRKKVNNVNV